MEQKTEINNLNRTKLFRNFMNEQKSKSQTMKSSFKDVVDLSFVTDTFSDKKVQRKFESMSYEEMISLKHMDVANLDDESFLNSYLPATRKYGLEFVFGGLYFVDDIEPPQISIRFGKSTSVLFFSNLGMNRWGHQGAGISLFLNAKYFIIRPLLLDEKTFLEEMHVHLPELDHLRDDLVYVMTDEDWDNF